MNVQINNNILHKLINFTFDIEFNDTNLRRINFDKKIILLNNLFMEIDNFYAKILQHMSLNSNQSGLYNTRIVMPFNTIVQNKEFQSNIQS